MRGTARQLPTCERGGVATTLGLALPILFGLVGVAVDYSSWSRQAALLKRAADAAALASARELAVAYPTDERISSVAESVVRSLVKAAEGDSETVVETAILKDRTGVRVIARQHKKAIMSKLVTPALTDLEVSATAALSGKRKICALGLDPSADRAVNLQGSSTVAAKDCDVQSNSTSQTGVSASAAATISATLTCSAGGIAGQSSIKGQTLTDCPAFPDPLADRPPPSVEPRRTSNKPIIDLGIAALPVVLTPGTYCGGLTIGGASVVLFTPGVYVIKDGPLLIDSLAVVKGDYAGFYFTGNVATPYVFRAAPNSVVGLTAPKDGPLAGTLFFEDRAAPLLRSFEVLSTTARTLIGTFYLPRGKFVASSNALIADKSAYTVIIARQLELNGNPTLTLNANYHQTDVPVPGNVGSAARTIRLVE